MRTENQYKRAPGFGTSLASRNNGRRYEEKVGALLSHLRPMGFTLKAQAPYNGGYVDFELKSPSSLFLIEVKSQWSLDAYKQLNHYAGPDTSSLARICICKTHHPHIPIPETYECLPLDRLLDAKKGRLTVIPWSGRNT